MKLENIGEHKELTSYLTTEYFLLNTLNSMVALHETFVALLNNYEM